MEAYYHPESFPWEEEDTIVQRETVREGEKRRRKKRWLLPVFASLLLLGYTCLALPIGWDIPQLRRTATLAHGWNLILVNREYHIPQDYPVDLVELRNGQKVDRRIYPELQAMFDAMRNDGIYPIVASGYRTGEKQRALLQEKTEEYESLGRCWWVARRDALQWVSKPGTSEHQLGIAVDINQDGNRSTARQVYDWLEENAHLYGFICRYPASKTAITGVSNEPWHYRYVGTEAAREIHEQGLCLEEYLEEQQKERDILFFD